MTSPVGDSVGDGTRTEAELAAASAMAAAPGDDSFEIRPIGPDDVVWVRRVLRQYWASEQVASAGKVLGAAELPGFGAWRGSEPVGLVTYHMSPTDDGNTQCEIVTHNSLAGSGGIGSCLLNAVKHQAREMGCSRLWLVTTNDNVAALRFYQRRDFDLCAFRRGGVHEIRRLKPEVPDLGLDNIPIRHELELELKL